MNNKVIFMVIIAAVVIGGILLLVNSQPQQTTVNVTTPTESTEPTTAVSPTEAAEDSMDKGEVKEFTVVGSNYKFNPATITVNQGDKVKIIFESTGSMHDFVIDELNVKTEVLGDGETETVEFTADEAGTFEYYCSVGSHRQMGMKGTLTVK